MSDKLIKALMVAAELTGTSFTPAGAKVLAHDLSIYPEDLVVDALTRCRQELKRGQLTPEAIVSRIADGRPGPEEAWAMLPESELETVVWTEETQKAWGVCRRLLLAGEGVQARMAFKEAYVALVREARAHGVPVRWIPSPGHDPEQRRAALIEASKKGLLTKDDALKLLPGTSFETGADGKVTALLALPNIPPKAKEALQALLARTKAARSKREAEAKERRESEHRSTYGDPQWCRDHGVKYDEHA